MLLVDHSAPDQATVRYDQAQLCVTAPIVTTYRRAGIAQLLAQPTTLAKECWRPIDLPHLGKVQTMVNEVAQRPINRVWIDFDYVVPESWDSSEQLMVYVPRITGEAWQISVDGQPIGDNLDNWRMTWNTPVVARLQPGRFKPGQALNIRLAIAFLLKLDYSLARITVGPASAVGRESAQRF